MKHKKYGLEQEGLYILNIHMLYVHIMISLLYYYMQCKLSDVKTRK